MKYTLTLLFLYNAEVRFALQLRHLSSKIQSGYVTRKFRIVADTIEKNPRLRVCLFVCCFSYSSIIFTHNGSCNNVALP